MHEFLSDLNQEYTDNFGTRFIERRAQIPIMPPKPSLKDTNKGVDVEADVYEYM